MKKANFVIAIIIVMITGDGACECCNVVEIAANGKHEPGCVKIKIAVRE